MDDPTSTYGFRVEIPCPVVHRNTLIIEIDKVFSLSSNKAWKRWVPKNEDRIIYYWDKKIQDWDKDRDLKDWCDAHDELTKALQRIRVSSYIPEATLRLLSSDGFECLLERRLQNS
jgi:hypothetical protein